MDKQEKKRMITNYSTNLVFYAFIFFTLLSSYLSYYNGYFGGELILLQEEYNNTYLYYLFFYYIIPIFIYYILYIKTKDIKFKHSIVLIEYKSIDNMVHIFFSLIIISFLIIFMTTSVGSISREPSGSRVAELAFALIQPVFLVIFYIYYYVDSTAKIYKLNIFIFVISLFMTGFTGHILYFIPLIISWSFKNFGRKGTILIIISGLLFLPFLRILKFMIQHSIDLNGIVEMYNFDFLLAFVKIVIDRFNYVPVIMFIDWNREYFNNHDIIHEYYPFFQGYIGSFYHKLFYGNGVLGINAELNFLLTGSYDSNATFPIVSYFSLDILYGIVVLIYSLILYFILFYFIKLYSKTNYYFNYLFFRITYLILLGGWFWPFMNFMQGIVIFTIFTIMVNTIKKQMILKKGNQ